MLPGPLAPRSNLSVCSVSRLTTSERGVSLVAFPRHRRTIEMSAPADLHSRLAPDRCHHTRSGVRLFVLTLREKFVYSPHRDDNGHNPVPSPDAPGGSLPRKRWARSCKYSACKTPGSDSETWLRRGPGGQAQLSCCGASSRRVEWKLGSMANPLARVHGRPAARDRAVRIFRRSAARTNDHGSYTGIP